MLRKNNAISIFWDYWDTYHKIIPKQLFDEKWGGASKYYYYVRHKFENMLERELVGELLEFEGE